MGNSPFGFIMYFIFNFMIKKFTMRLQDVTGNYEQTMMPLCREMVQQQVLLQAQQAHKPLTSSTFLVDANIV